MDRQSGPTDRPTDVVVLFCRAARPLSGDDLLLTTIPTDSTSLRVAQLLIFFSDVVAATHRQSSKNEVRKKEQKRGNILGLARNITSTTYKRNIT